MSLAGGYDLAARRARHFMWVERRLFEVLGGWVPTVAEGEVKMTLREHSFQHAWHAELWADLLPAGDGNGPGPAPPSSLAPVLEAVAEPLGTLERLAGAYRVLLPRLVVSYSQLREGASGLADRALLRALGLMLADDVEAWRVGEGLVQALVRSDADAEQAGRHATAVEALVVAAGGTSYNE